MDFQVESIEGKYYVSAKIILPPDNLERWHIIKDFDYRQGDAMLFRDGMMRDANGNAVVRMANRYLEETKKTRQWEQVK